MKKLFLSLFAFAAFTSNAQLPAYGGVAALPDSWLLNNGQPFHYKSTASPSPRVLPQRSPTAQEQAIIDKADALIRSKPAKAIALVAGDEIVWTKFQDPKDADKLFMSMSVGKTITALAAGKAICSNKIALDTLTAEVVPELKDRDLGKSKLVDLLKMSAGTWEGNSDSTVFSGSQERAVNNGKASLLELISDEKVSSFQNSFFKKISSPGADFSYKSTDPLTVGVIINRVTGFSYAKYVQQEIFNPAGLSNAGVIGQDWFEFGRSDGSVRLRLDDWIKLAVWVRESLERDDCFGKYLQAASKTQIKNISKKSGATFDGYGYFMWTENTYAKDSFWAVGHGGQRIGWNNRNKRIILAFSNHETYMVDLYRLYDEWINLD